MGSNKLYHNLLLQVEAVISYSDAEILVDTRPAALHAIKVCEDNLHNKVGLEESNNKKSADKQCRECAREAAANGAGKAHK